MLQQKHVPVRRACANCHNDHKRCDNERPCRRCLAKGVECVEQGGKRKRRSSGESLEQQAAKNGVMMMSFRLDSKKPPPKKRSKFSIDTTPKSSPNNSSSNFAQSVQDSQHSVFSGHSDMSSSASTRTQSASSFNSHSTSPGNGFVQSQASNGHYSNHPFDMYSPQRYGAYSNMSPMLQNPHFHSFSSPHTYFASLNNTNQAASQGIFNSTPSSTVSQSFPSPNQQNVSASNPEHNSSLTNQLMDSQNLSNQKQNNPSKVQNSSSYFEPYMPNSAGYKSTETEDPYTKHQGLIKAMEEFKQNYLKRAKEFTPPQLDHKTQFESTTRFEDVTTAEHDPNGNADILDNLYMTNGGSIASLNSRQKIILRDPVFLETFNRDDVGVIIMSKAMMAAVYEEPENLSKSFFCNAAYASMLGVPIDELTSKDFSHANLGLYKWCKTLQHNQTIRKNHQFLLQGGRVLEFKIVIQARDELINALCSVHMNYDAYVWMSFEKIDTLDDSICLDGKVVIPPKRTFSSAQEMLDYYNGHENGRPHDLAEIDSRYRTGVGS